MNKRELKSLIKTLVEEAIKNKLIDPDDIAVCWENAFADAGLEAEYNDDFSKDDADFYITKKGNKFETGILKVESFDKEVLNAIYDSIDLELNYDFDESLVIKIQPGLYEIS